MQKIVVTSRNGYFKYSGNLITKLSLKGTEFKGSIDVGDSNGSGNLMICFLSKKPFKKSRPSIVYGDSESSFSREDYRDDLYRSFYTVKIKNQNYFMKVIDIHGVFDGRYEKEDDESNISFSLLKLRELKKAAKGNCEIAYFHFDNLSIPFISDLSKKSVEHYLKTWRVLKATPVEKIDIENYIVKEPILIQIPLKKFKLKSLDEKSDKNPYVALMMKYGLSLKNEKEYINEINRCLEKTKGKFCYIFLVPLEEGIKRGFKGFFLEDEGIA